MVRAAASLKSTKSYLGDLHSDSTDEPSLPYLRRDTPLLLDPLSPNHITRIAEWLSTCSKTHPRCCPAQTGLPTRLIDLGSNSTYNMHLVETKHLQATVNYVALSHLWGTHQPLTSTKASVASRLRGIVMGDLSPTYRDAIHVCRSLQIRYLWIDSLCIIQDDEADWQRECSRMASVYGSCIFTIAPDAADESVMGFLLPRDHQQLQYIDDDGQLFNIHARYVPEHPTPEGRSFNFSPLLLRAWVYQERLLSPRVVRFTKSEVQFECQTSCDCECGRYQSATRPRSIKHMFVDSSGQKPPFQSGIEESNVGVQKSHYTTAHYLLQSNNGSGLLKTSPTWELRLIPIAFLLYRVLLRHSRATSSETMLPVFGVRIYHTFSSGRI